MCQSSQKHLKLSSENGKIKLEANELVNENVSLNKKLQEVYKTLESKESEIKALVKDREDLKSDKQVLSAEVEIIAKKHQNDLKNNFQCIICAQKFENKEDVKMHVGNKHCVDS